MKVLVTGATGLIGGHLVKLLNQRGIPVKALVRESSNIDNLPKDKVEHCLGDIMNPASLIEAARDCDLILHAAGTFSYWGYDEATFMNEARTGMENIVAAAVANKIKKLVFTSSSVTCGAMSKPQVLSEEAPGDFAEIPVYIKAKKLQEDVAFELGKKNKIKVIAACPTLTIGGPDSHLTESNRMIVNYLKDPYKSTWPGGCNLVSVEDVAKAILLLAEKGKAGERYIIGSDNYEWKQVHSLISELTGMPGPFLTATHASAYLLSSFIELYSHLTNEHPSSTREQAKMVGKYYWYSSDKLKKLGFEPEPSTEALIAAISWLVTTEHIPAALRSLITLSDKIHSYRNQTSPL